MTWIEENIGKRNQLKRRIGTIRANSPTVYDALWRAIAEDIENATDRGMDVGVEGNGDERRVWSRPAHPRPGLPDELIVTLHRTDGKIEINGPQQRLSFDIDLDDTGVVRLMFKGEQIDFPDASRNILEPFLFPDLK